MARLLPEYVPDDIVEVILAKLPPQLSSSWLQSGLTLDGEELVLDRRNLRLRMGKDVKVAALVDDGEPGDLFHLKMCLLLGLAGSLPGMKKLTIDGVHNIGLMADGLGYLSRALCDGGKERAPPPVVVDRHIRSRSSYHVARQPAVWLNSSIRGLGEKQIFSLNPLFGR